MFTTRSFFYLKESKKGIQADVQYLISFIILSKNSETFKKRHKYAVTHKYSKNLLKISTKKSLNVLLEKSYITSTV